MDRRKKLEQLARYTDARTIRDAVAAAKRGSSEGRLQLSATMAWVAYSCPDACEAVCDNIASAWLGKGPTPEVPRGLPEAPLEESFWQAFWKVIDGHDEGYDALTITVAVASLGEALHEEMGPIAEQHALHHPGAAAAQVNPIPSYNDVDALSKCDHNSLGYAWYRLIVDNGYDPEVLGRDDIGLNELPHVLHYLNARILQMHEVWHLVAGYETTSSGEIAISAFQLAQFGHNYSSMFLAAVMAISTFKEPRGFTILMQIINEGWQHGRESPAMMNIAWEEEWDTPIAELREKYQVPAYQSVFPPDLLESVEEASIWKKLLLGMQLLRYNMRLRKDGDLPAQQYAA
jgi:ubiquinone biosynthesis protein Coq4